MQRCSFSYHKPLEEAATSCSCRSLILALLTQLIMHEMGKVNILLVKDM